MYLMYRRHRYFAPDDGAPEGGGSTSDAHGADDGQDQASGSDEIRRLRDEAAKRRVQAREATKALEEMQAKLAALETAKLEEQQQYKTLAEMRAEELSAERTKYESLTQKLRSDRTRRAVQDALETHGVKDVKARELIAKGLLADVDVEYDEDHKPVTDFAALTADIAKQFVKSESDEGQKDKPKAAGVIPIHGSRPRADGVVTYQSMHETGLKALEKARKGG